MRKRILVTIASLAALVLIGIGILLLFAREVSAPQASVHECEVKVEIDDRVQYCTELADSQEERYLGLSNRAKLAQDSGMLFTFDSIDQHGIVMRDMNFDLDILWMDSGGEIIHLVEQASPESYPDIFRPDQPASYVLEINAGQVAEHNITLGQIVNTNLLEQ